MKPLLLAQRKALGALLVALQFACMLVLPALALPALRQGTIPATTLLLGGASLAWMSDPAPGWTVWACLALVLCVKSTFEERWMREQHPAYGDYAARSKRFVPLIF